MIVYPEYWQGVGQPVSIKQVEDALMLIVSEIDCDCLSLSGGLDSSLLLYYMLEQGRKVRTFTIANDENHPDIKYSRMVVAALGAKFGVKINGNWRVLKTGLVGDDLVRAFYKGVRQWTGSIVAGDGLDEFMAGYYAHQSSPNEDVYYNHLWRLQEAHLKPLNDNSGDVRVYLPYMHQRLVHLMAQIPLREKVDLWNRKKVVVELAEGKLPQEIIERKKYGFGTAREKLAVVGGKG